MGVRSLVCEKYSAAKSEERICVDHNGEKRKERETVLI